MLSGVEASDKPGAVQSDSPVQFVEAVVEAEVSGQTVTIDFLNHVLGTDPSEIRKHAVDILVPVAAAEGGTEIPIPVMHPLHVLQSRIANVVRLERPDCGGSPPSDRPRLRQANAAPIILREYVNERLDQEMHREATGTLRRLAFWIGSDEMGRQAHSIVETDPLAVLSSFSQDLRLDARWRDKTLAPLIGNLNRQRTSRASQAAATAAKLGLGRT